MTAAANPVEVTVEGEDRLYIEGKRYVARRLKINYQDFESTVWIDYDGRTLREHNQMGFRMQIVSEQNAQRGIRTGGDPVDVLAIYSIIPGRPIKNPRQVKQIKVRLENIDLAGLTVETDNQRLSSIDPLILEINRPDIARIQSLAITQIASRVDSTWLVATPFIQTGDKAIHDKAKEIVGVETDALAAAIELQQWVYENIKKQFTISVPSAVEVLSTLEGDC
ncbi:MAG: transglutaminase domain-containing protein, partial [Planctomycetes bacterium]|nr:transglutaminase domain-containing protein [Planctomycetota bacterium]